MMKLDTLAGADYVDPAEVAHVRPVQHEAIPKGISESQKARLEARAKIRAMVTLKGRVAVIATTNSVEEILASMDKATKK